MDAIVSTIVNGGDTLDDQSDYDKPMNTENSDLKAYDKGTIDGPVAEIIMMTEQESEATDPGNQVKAITYSIPWKKSMTAILVEPSKGNRAPSLGQNHIMKTKKIQDMC